MQELSPPKSVRVPALAKNFRKSLFSISDKFKKSGVSRQVISKNSNSWPRALPVAVKEDQNVSMQTSPSGALVDQVFLRCVEDCFEPIMLTDRSAKLKYVNPAWTLTYGYSQEEALGKTPKLLRSNFQNEDFYQEMWKTIQDPQYGFWRGEIINRAKDGHHVPVLLTITPYRAVNGEIAGYMGIAVDLTEQKKMEQQILIQDRLASIGLLAGGLAHEIGNPLGVIRGRAELVLSQVKGQEAVEKNMEVIISQIDRISTLMHSLLNFSRAPSSVKLQSVNLKETVSQVVSLMQEACSSAKIDLNCDLQDQVVIGEPTHIQQVFLNLILNSIHAIDAKLKVNELSKKTISISTMESDEGESIVKVMDTGCGMNPHHLDKVFQPFFTTKPPGKGTGLGLSIVAKLMTEMNGKISAESGGEGLGATFTLKFKKAKN